VVPFPVGIRFFPDREPFRSSLSYCDFSPGYPTSPKPKFFFFFFFLPPMFCNWLLMSLLFFQEREGVALFFLWTFYLFPLVLVRHLVSTQSISGPPCFLSMMFLFFTNQRFFFLRGHAAILPFDLFPLFAVQTLTRAESLYSPYLSALFSRGIMFPSSAGVDPCFFFFSLLFLVTIGS